MVIIMVTKFLFRAWFSTWLTVGIIVNWTSCVAVYRIGGGTLKTKQTRCAVISHYVFKWLIIKMCPWIRISTPPMDDMMRLMDQDKVLLLLNHTSFFDTILFVGTIPARAIGRYRALMKHRLLDDYGNELHWTISTFLLILPSCSLPDNLLSAMKPGNGDTVLPWSPRGANLPEYSNLLTEHEINLDLIHFQPKVPLFGDLLRMVGHFPVYFRSSEQHVFTVEKEKQEKVMEKVQAHVATNGGLCIFPEARLNRTPETLDSFRKGIFSLAEEQQMAVATLSTVGNNISWPIDDVVGGLPSKITMKISEIFEAGHGMSAETIREKAHETMQADVTYLFAERGASKPKQT